MYIFGYPSFSSMISSKHKKKKKEYEMSSKYNPIFDVLNFIFTYLDSLPVNSLEGKKRLFKEMTCSEQLERFLPDNPEMKKYYWGDEKQPGNFKNDFIRISEKCVSLFIDIFGQTIYVKDFINEIFDEVITLNKEIKNTRDNRWSYEYFWDYTVDTYYGDSALGSTGYEEMLEKSKIEFAERLSKLIKAYSYQKVITDRIFENEELSEETAHWKNRAITIKTWADRYSYPGGLKMRISAGTEHGKECAEIRIRKTDNCLVVNEMKFEPKKCSNDWKKYISESVVYHFLAELLLQNESLCGVRIDVVKEHDCQIHDIVAKAHKFTVSMKGSTSILTWNILRKAAEELVGSGPRLLVRSDENGVSKTLKLAIS